MSTIESMKSQDVSPRVAIIAILVFLVLSGGVIFGVVKLFSGSVGGDFAVERNERARTSARDTASPATATATDDAIIVKRNLFRARGTSDALIPANADVPPPVPEVPFQVAPVTPAAPPAPPQPKLAYTGNVEIGDESFALIENLETKLAEYARVGSMVYGYTLKTIQPEMVTLEANGQTVTLNLGANKVEEPTAPPKPATPAQPNQPTAQPANNTPPPTAANGGNGQPNRDFRGRGGMRGTQEGQ